MRGACSNNLRNVDVDIPRRSLVVITGISGSGKSSLAFDTLYAEGQRRYMNTLSPYARHFMGVLEKPAVESISGLSPVIAIEQKTTGNNPRSTVGTVTEISDFLRLLFAKASTAFSPVTGEEMVRYTDAAIVDLISEEYKGRRCILLAPLVRGRKGHYKELFDQMRRKGYTQMRVDGELLSLDSLEALDRYKPHFIELVVDKLKPGGGDQERIRSSVGTALGLGKGSVAVMDAESGVLRHFSKHFVDPSSGVSIREPAPHTFSFNSPEGCCPHCKGLGTIVDVDIDKMVPDKRLSIADGAVVPLGKIRQNRRFEILRALARRNGFSLYEPVDELPDGMLSLVLFGSEDLFRVGEGTLSEMLSWPGVVEDVEDKVVCPLCHGNRLNPESLCFKIDGKDIAEVSEMELSSLYDWLQSLPGKLSARASAVARDILKELLDRVRFLLDVGLDYLSLDRPTSSLSGGESQRIRLATQIGSKLVNVIYILDEPSIGLHPRDNGKLLESLKKLRDSGNTVIVVEHDADTMRSADWLVDVGPLAGELGGKICFSGTPDKLSGSSITLDYLSGKRSIAVPAGRRRGNGKFLTLKGACGNNLKNLDISFPLACLIGIAGVSGSGKSSLVNQTLMPILKGRFYRLRAHPLPYSSIEGIENIDKVIEIDQSPIGRSPRSNPATFTGVMSDIRELFEQTADAKVRGFKAGRFSFNVEGGRCPECKGAGIKVIEMNFLPSVHVVCDVCGGRRYKEDTLAVRYKGKNINDVLEMSIAEAYEFFKAHPGISRKLGALMDVGLGYVRLGQSAVTLSGGESQRMKLAAELFRKATGNTLYMLDEPTTGLHFEDIKALMDVLQKLVDQGNTVIVIEHNLDVLKMADYIFDMGPGGGAKGGMVVAAGTPEEVAADPRSVTGEFLQKILDHGRNK